MHGISEARPCVALSWVTSKCYCQDGPSKLRLSRGGGPVEHQEGLSRGAGRRRSRPPSAVQGKSKEYDGQDFNFDYAKDGNEEDRESFRGNL